MRALVRSCTIFPVATFLSSQHQACHGPLTSVMPHYGSDHESRHMMPRKGTWIKCSGCSRSSQPSITRGDSIKSEHVMQAECQALETSCLPHDSSTLSLRHPGCHASAPERRHLRAWKLWPPWLLHVLHAGMVPSLCQESCFHPQAPGRNLLEDCQEPRACSGWQTCACGMLEDCTMLYRLIGGHDF